MRCRQRSAASLNGLTQCEPRIPLGAHVAAIAYPRGAQLEGEVPGDAGGGAGVAIVAAGRKNPPSKPTAIQVASPQARGCGRIKAETPSTESQLYCGVEPPARA